MQLESLLTKIDDRTIPDNPSEIRLVACVRNEFKRLPFFLNYYRALGVNRFIFVDDHSVDGGRDFLLAQTNCHVFSPNNSFQAANCGVDWYNLLLDRYGMGYWTLTVDMDELLVYPHCETVKLKEFCAYLSEEGSTAFYTFMLDMYPDRDLSKAVCDPGKAFYDICPYFDSDYVFVPRFKFFSNPIMRFPPEDVIGGPRLRKFYPEQQNASLLNQLWLRVVWKSVNLLSKMKIGISDKPHKSPTLFKVPLMKWHKGCARLSNHHVTAPSQGKLSPITGVLMHFKFFADFHDKAKEEVRRGQHYAGAQEYKRYLRHVAANSNVSFMYKGSVRYRDSNTILKHGLMRTTDGLDRFAANLVI